MTDKELKEILERLSRLEDTVFSVKRKSVKNENEDFSGATGGMRFLKSEGFFKTKRALGEVRNELAKHDYHYSIHAVQAGINRLSKASGPLVAFKEGGKKVYAERK